MLKKFNINLSIVIGGIMLSLLFIIIIIGPLFINKEQILQPDIISRLKPPVFMEGGDWSNPLGTDPLGRDILGRIVYGTRLSLTLSFLSVFIASIIGVILGTIAGYYRGFLENVIMRIAESQMAFPFMLLAVFLMAFFKPNFINLLIVFVIAGWPIYTKIVRGIILDLRDQEFVEAAYALGASDLRILISCFIPNIMNYVAILGTLQLAKVIFAEAGLSFIGIGFPPPTPALGLMIGEGRNYLATAWWVATMPGIIIVYIILSMNLLSDGLRDVLDPKRKID